MHWIRCLLVLLVVAPLHAAHADDAAAGAAQTTIDQQIQAFLNGDDDAAYSHAGPNIRRMFPTRDAFMAMVRKGYPQVHSPRNYAFGRFEMLAPGRIRQHVLILGPDGKDYEAVYTLEMQPDGVFRINAVSIREGNIPSI
ncbi:DUF4864 domain-containing protein [Mesorhizobium microcysteis]|jgi:hypothetical protein|uniref:DUF4864 domain-containing protein n=1 Tax=Neoaquamicrobium microcysteis TaxID=2682781 RepID=A0A5D4H5C6_9HYPH|nr:DUF4864 domain-containing protein [Mesorhizobium microcysteis]TYR35229.1 DUF4864 domain-containing protein [Mesorhizobium microcysteis]